MVFSQNEFFCHKKQKDLELNGRCIKKIIIFALSITM